MAEDKDRQQARARSEATRPASLDILICMLLGLRDEVVVDACKHFNAPLISGIISVVSTGAENKHRLLT
jgi:hypothetical protein